MPINYMIIQSLYRYHEYYGDDFVVAFPTGSDNFMNLKQIGDELYSRLSKLFLTDANGKRPIFNNYTKMQNDPEFKDYILFHEYFDGDNGKGLGASHQTGWTGLIACGL